MKKNFILLFLSALLFAGCSSDYEVLKSYQSVILTTDSSVRVMGQTITFTLKDDAGNDLTAEAKFAVDGITLEGNTFSSPQPGRHEATATYLGIESAPVMIYFHDGTEINFRKKVLLEDYTGTWCGYCPRVAHAIEMVKAQVHDDAIAVGLHGPSSNPNDSGYDPFTFDATELESQLSASGYPKGFINRMTQWTFPEPSNVAQAVAFTQGENPRLGVAMNSSMANNAINLEVKVMFGKDFTENLKLVVYVLENGLIHEQHNYTAFYDDVDLIADFEHNHVLRACLTHILGDPLDGADTTFSKTFTRSFNVPVPANVANADNIEFVAFVIDPAGNVVNVRRSVPGESQEFELL